MSEAITRELDALEDESAAGALDGINVASPPPLIAFLPWEAEQQRTLCAEHEARSVATKLARDNPGKAVHVVRAEHVDFEPAERPVVWDTYAAPPPEKEPSGDGA